MELSFKQIADAVRKCDADVQSKICRLIPSGFFSEVASEVRSKLGELWKPLERSAGLVTPAAFITGDKGGFSLTEAEVEAMTDRSCGQPKLEAHKSSKAQAESSSQAHGLVEQFREFGPFALAAAAIGAVWFLWLKRSTFKSLFARALELVGLSHVKVGNLKPARSVWSRVTGLPDAAEFNSAVEVGRRLNIVRHELGVSEAGLVLLMAFLHDLEVEDYVRFIEMGRDVASIKRAQQTSAWPLPLPEPND